jgi:hypothetical protein
MTGRRPVTHGTDPNISKPPLCDDGANPKACGADGSSAAVASSKGCGIAAGYVEYYSGGRATCTHSSNFPGTSSKPKPAPATSGPKPTPGVPLPLPTPKPVGVPAAPQPTMPTPTPKPWGDGLPMDQGCLTTGREPCERNGPMVRSRGWCLTASFSAYMGVNEFACVGYSDKDFGFFHGYGVDYGVSAGVVGGVSEFMSNGTIADQADKFDYVAAGVLIVDGSRSYDSDTETWQYGLSAGIGAPLTWTGGESYTDVYSWEWDQLFPKPPVIRRIPGR